MEQKAIHRLFEYLERRKTRHTRFEKEVGISNGYLNTTRQRNGDLGETILRKVLQSDERLSAAWLLTGKGSMFLAQSEAGGYAAKDESGPSATDSLGLETIVDGLRFTIRAQEKAIAAQEKAIAALEAQIDLMNRQP